MMLSRMLWSPSVNYCVVFGSCKLVLHAVAEAGLSCLPVINSPSQQQTMGSITCHSTRFQLCQVQISCVICLVVFLSYFHVSDLTVSNSDAKEKEPCPRLAPTDILPV